VLWATAKLEDGERSSLTIFEHRIGVIREFVEAKKTTPKANFIRVFCRKFKTHELEFSFFAENSNL